MFGKLMVLEGADPIAVVAVRAAVAFTTMALLLSIFSPQSLRLRWREWPFFLAFGLLGVAGSYATYMFALKYTTVTTAVVIGYTYPAFVALLATLLLGESFNVVKAISLLLALAGCFFVAQGYSLDAFQVNLRGILFSFATSFALTAYNVMGKHAVRTYGPWKSGLYGFGFGAAWLILIATPQNVLSLRLSTAGWAIVLAWAWLPTVLGYALYLAALKHIEVSKAAILCTLEPVSAIVLACLFLGETVLPLQLLGGALVLAGVVVLGWRREVRNRPATAHDAAIKRGIRPEHCH